jgi:hypothetical protein
MKFLKNIEEMRLCHYKIVHDFPYDLSEETNPYAPSQQGAKKTYVVCTSKMSLPRDALLMLSDLL